MNTYLMKTHFVVSGILLSPSGKILLLRKSMKDKIYPGKWSFCSGYVKEFEAGEDTILREIKEETGISATLLKRGKILEIIDENVAKRWIIASFLCRSESETVYLCHENSEFRWVDSSEISNFETVPGLEKDLKVLGLQ